MWTQNVAGIGEVSAVQIQTDGSADWQSAVTRWGGMWEVDNLPGPGQYNLQVTLVDGQMVCISSLNPTLVAAHIPSYHDLVYIVCICVQ